MTSQNGNGNATPGDGGGTAAAAGQPAPQLNILTQYIKDLSFESPNAPTTLQGPGENPNMQISVNVNVQNVAEETFEVELNFEAHAKNDDGVIYNLEMVYAGLFKLANLPQASIEPVLFIECPALLFPFVRRLVFDLTREGGFPPIGLDPINFAALYQQNLAKQGKQETAES